MKITIQTDPDKEYERIKKVKEMRSMTPGFAPKEQEDQPGQGLPKGSGDPAMHLAMATSQQSSEAIRRARSLSPPPESTSPSFMGPARDARVATVSTDIPNDYTPDKLETVKRLRQPSQPDVTPPSQAMYPRDTSAANQAQQLESKAMAPKPDPFQGWSPLKRMLGQAMQGAAEGSIHANDEGGYQGYLERQRQADRLDRNDLLSRAKELRAQDLSERTLYQNEQNAQSAREQHQYEFDANLEETKRLRATQEAAQERLANQPINVPQGTTVLDPQTRQPIYTNPKTQTAAEKGLQHVAGTINGQNAWAVFDPNPEPGKGRFTDPATGADVSNVFKPMPPPVQFLPGPTGEIAATGNPRTGQITPIQNPAGARRSPVPAGMLKDQRELENSQRKLTDLRTAFKPEFVGPVEGRMLRLKSKLPGFATPPGWGTFIALQADLKNSVIKLITGAQMGKEEANRILDQVPTETDKPEIWLDKFGQTQKNVEYLNQLIADQTGIGGAPPANPNVVNVEKWERDPATGLPRKVAK